MQNILQKRLNGDKRRFFYFLVNSHLFMNSENSDYIFFHINYDPPGE